METLELKLPYSDITLLLDALRHYTQYINDLDETEVDDDTYADLMNDLQSIEGLEKHITLVFKEKFGEY